MKKQKVQSEWLPQRLVKLTESEAKPFLRDDGYGLQEKYNGKHLFVIHDGKTTKAANKLGIFVDVPPQIAGAVAKFEPCVIEGEFMDSNHGNYFIAYDLLSFRRLELFQMPYYARLAHLKKLIGKMKTILVAPIWTGDKKQIKYDELNREGAEGIVLKNIGGYYKIDERKSLDMIAVKFWVEGDFIVLRRKKDKDAVVVGLFGNSGKIVECGSVTAIGHPEAQEGAIIEVKYLYYDKSALVQPSVLRARDDKPASECTTAQLKRRPKFKED